MGVDCWLGFVVFCGGGLVGVCCTMGFDFGCLDCGLSVKGLFVHSSLWFGSVDFGLSYG